MEAGYHHIPLHKSQYHLFGFEFEGRTYSWRQLFFGLSGAPYIFTMILRDIASRWRFAGICLLHYLDDFLIVARSRALCEAHKCRVRDDLVALGFVIESVKSVLDPCQVLDFLGYTVDTRGKPSFSVPTERIAKLRATLREVQVAGTGYIKVRRVASLAGQLMSMSLALSPARLFTRGLYDVVKPTSRGDLPGGWNAKVRLTADALSEVAFWIGGLPLWNGRLMFKDPGGVVSIPRPTQATSTGGGGGCLPPRSKHTHRARQSRCVRSTRKVGDSC